MLKVQQLFRTNSTTARQHLAQELCISIKEKDNRILLKYDQIDSPMGNPLTQECRGLILDTRTYDVVSFPLPKFFNHGEGHAAKLDMASAYVLEKVDGTCMTLYFYEGEWHVQTLGMMDAEGLVADFNLPFSDLFWNLFGGKEECLSKLNLNTNYTYTFEVATKYNRVVTRYEGNKVALLSVRNRSDLQELQFEDLEKIVAAWNCPVISLPKRWKMASLDDAAKMAATLPQMEEGYVVVDKYFNRVKIKNPAYVAIAHLKESSTSSAKGLVAIALTNEGSEFLTYFPEYTEMYNKISAKIANTASHMKSVYEECKAIANQKEFALAIQAAQVSFPAILFSLRAGKLKSVEEGMSQLDAKRALEVLKLNE